MTDHFAVLHLPRCAALDPDVVRQAFQNLAAKAHPDHAAAEGRTAAAAAFQALNAAQTVLANTASRLLHLAELVGGERPRGGVLGGDLLGLFARIGPALQVADSVLHDVDAAQSALARALHAPRRMAVDETLAGVGADLAALRHALEEKLPVLDAALSADPANALPQLAGLAQEAAFLTRWEAQLQQRRLRLVQAE